jgi:outer membrane protein
MRHIPSRSILIILVHVVGLTLAAASQTGYQKDPPLRVALVGGYRSAYPASDDQQRFVAFATHYAKEHGYTVLIDAGSSDENAPYIVYAAQSIDISRAVTKAFAAMTAEAAGSPPLGSESSSPQITDARIGTMEFQKAVTETNEFQRAFESLQRKCEPQLNQLASQTAEIDQLKERSGTAQLSEEERRSLQKTIDQKENEKDKFAQAEHDAYMADLNRLYDGVASKFWDTESSFATQNGYTIVLDKAVRPNGILWIADGIAPESLVTRGTDITSTLVSFYNSK